MYHAYPPCMDEKQQPRNAAAWENTAHLPQSAAQSAAKRHTDRPANLHRGKVYPYGVPVILRQAPQPIPDRLDTSSGSVKNNRYFNWSRGSYS